MSRGAPHYGRRSDGGGECGERVEQEEVRLFGDIERDPEPRREPREARVALDGAQEVREQHEHQQLRRVVDRWRMAANATRLSPI